MTNDERQTIFDLIGGIRTLNIPRIEDLPYWTSPPVQFVYESTAALSLGSYTWDDAPSIFTPPRPVLNNAMYFFRNISLAADISELDFTSAITTTPQFFTFLQSDAQAPLFREPVSMVKFLNDFEYRFTWQSQQGSDIIYAAFRGALTQTAALLGKSSITLKAIISAQEINEENYINLFRTKYPASSRAGG